MLDVLDNDVMSVVISFISEAKSCALAAISKSFQRAVEHAFRVSRVVTYTRNDLEMLEPHHWLHVLIHRRVNIRGVAFEQEVSV